MASVFALLAAFNVKRLLHLDFFLVQQPLLKDELRFPQTVEVAVGVDRLDLVALAEREADLRLFAGM